MTTESNRPTLTVLRGGKLTPAEFAALPLQGKLDHLHRLDGAGKARTILHDQKPRVLVRSLPMEDIYQILHEVGPENSLEILQLAAPAQINFILDWELWEGWTLSVDRMVKWLEILLAAGEELAIDIISELDQELLLVFLKKTISVGGGLGDIVNNEDLQIEWDHTFDEIYYIKYLDSRHSMFILRVLDLIYRENHHLYNSLMMGVENELLSELEELAGQFRRSRLEDEGFPTPADAATIYARITPEHFTPGRDKVDMTSRTDLSPLPVIPGEEGTLLLRAFAAADSPALRQEFHYLANSAMVAEGVTPSDHEKMLPVMTRIGNYLNIALEYLCTDEAAAVATLKGEHLRKLFSLGHSLLLQLQERAKRAESDNYAADRALLGLRMKRPLFYRGLDHDTIDDYREFSSMEDVRRADEFLRALEAAGRQ